MPSLALIDATDLEAWANRRDAQERLPQLVRRLILATASSVTRVSFRAGEGVQLGGWDGIAEAGVETPFVPHGASGWEMGTSRDPKSKAESDYSARRDNPADVDPSTATFVFVTPRRWTGKKDWAAKKKKEGRWRDVRVYDCDDLHTWLEAAPSVHAWISGHLGKDIAEYQDLETCWTDWCQATTPPLSAGLVIGGRDDIADRVARQASAPPGVIGVHGDSRDEAFAFIAASMWRLPEADRDVLFARALAVHEPGAWRRIVISERPLLLVPLFDGADAAKAVRAGHTVLIPLDRDGAQGEMLPRIRRAAAKQALMDMGFGDKRAEELATTARRSLLSLRRQLAVSPELKKPKWAQPDTAPAILPAILAGTWEESRIGDQEALSNIGGRDYQTIARDVTRWANAADPPVRRIGTMWLVASKEDAWSQICGFLTASDQHRFEAAAVRALGTVDVTVSLPGLRVVVVEEANASHTASAWLRGGISDTLALMGSYNSLTLLPDGGTGPALANRVVRKLLVDANADVSAIAWRSLAPELPLLAEAAPEVFLQEVDASLSGSEPLLMSLFTDGEADPLYSSSPHTGLLWALEGLAWCPDHLAHAALLLARLARLDPDGRLGNRPHRSLHGIFLPWWPQTAASVDRRLDVLDMLRRNEPAAAWKLLVGLLPEPHMVGLPSHTPQRRDWEPDDRPAVTRVEWDAVTSRLVAWLLEDVGLDSDRWKDLIQRLGNLSVDARNKVIERLEMVDARSFTDSDRSAIRDAFRSVIARHQQYPGAVWAMPAAEVDRLRAMHQRFGSASIIDSAVQLFSRHPDLIDVGPADYDVRERALRKERERVVRALHAEGGVAELLSLAERVDRPDSVGWVLSLLGLPRSEENEVLAETMSPKLARKQLALSYADGRFSIGGWPWLHEILETTHEWSPLQRAELLTALPSSSLLWDSVAQYGSETEGHYWQLWSRPPSLSKPDEYATAASNLVKHGRPFAAVDLLASHINAADDAGWLPVAVIALEAAVAKGIDQDVDAMTLSYDIGTLLDFIQTAGAIDDDRLGRLEWSFLPVLGYGTRAPVLLHRILSTDPAFFVQVVSLVYKSDEDDQADSTSVVAGHVERGWELLHSWHTMPGRRDEKSIDVAALRSWIIEARTLLAACGRKAVGDLHIGHVLRYSPEDGDEMWPPTAIRELIEELKSEDIETGIEIEVHNSRGVTVRGLTDGGAQERSLVRRYRSYAKRVTYGWPRTAAMLNRIAEAFERDARREDIKAELTEDM